MTTLAAYFHEFDPIIVRLWGDFAVRWYGVSYLAGFVVGYPLLIVLSRRGWLQIPRERIADAMMWLIGGVIIGGRLGYLAVYDPTLFITFTTSPPFWGVLAINQGGMASHGGLVGVILAAWRISRGWKNPDGSISGRCSIWHVFDAMALGCVPGLLFGRLANFVNGELLGRVYSAAPVDGGKPGPWWTVQFPTEIIERADDLSNAQRAGVADLARRIAPELSMKESLHAIVAHAGELKSQLQPLLYSRHPSQLYQAAAEGLVVGALLWLMWWMKPRTAGLIGCAFMVLYGGLRVVTEFWRLPDAQFGGAGQISGLSRGQWLSVGMMVVGTVAAVIRLTRTAAEPKA